MNVLAEICTGLASACLLVWALATHPHRAQCPRGWFVNGVRPSGSFECLRDRDPSAGERAPSGGHDSISGRIMCDAPSFMPRVRDERTVSCGSTIP